MTARITDKGTVLVVVAVVAVCFGESLPLLKRIFVLPLLTRILCTISSLSNYVLYFLFCSSFLGGRCSSCLCSLCDFLV